MLSKKPYSELSKCMKLGGNASDLFMDLNAAQTVTHTGWSLSRTKACLSYPVFRLSTSMRFLCTICAKEQCYV